MKLLKLSLSGVLLSSLFVFSPSIEASAEEDVLEPITKEQIKVNYDDNIQSLIQPLGAGEWDRWQGNPDELYATPGYARTFNTVYSGGGDFKVRVNLNDTGGPLTLKLYEEDPSGYTLIKTVKGVNQGEEHVFNVRGYTDGDNKKAELFVNVISSGNRVGVVSLSYWD